MERLNPMSKVCQVQVRSVYGNDLVYPVCDVALSFARIARTKTLARDVLREIESLGYTLENIPVAPFALATLQARG